MTTPEPPKPTATEESEWMSVDDATDWLGLTTVSEKRAFRRAINSGEIPAVRLSAKIIKLHKPTFRARYSCCK